MPNLTCANGKNSSKLSYANYCLHIMEGTIYCCNYSKYIRNNTKTQWMLKSNVFKSAILGFEILSVTTAIRTKNANVSSLLIHILRETTSYILVHFIGIPVISYKQDGNHLRSHYTRKYKRYS